MSTPQTKLHYYSVEEYLALERASLERHEYMDGQIFAMAGESPAHGRISINLIGELFPQLKGTQCELFTKDLKVLSGPDPKPIWPPKNLFSYPDILVLCGEGEYHDHYQDILLNPKVIIEVLSGATAEYDFSEKFRRYRSWLPTLSDYILVSQFEAAIDHYRKLPNGDWVLSPLEGLEAVLQIESISCTVKLSDVYARVQFKPRQIEQAQEQLENKD